MTVTGAGNTISSGSGTALDVADTTIGAAGLTFQEHLRQRRGQGHRARQHRLDRRADGDRDRHDGGSGGTIQNNSARGVEIVNATNITLDNMNFVNSSTTDGAVATDTNTASLNAAIYLNGVGNVSLGNDQISGTNQEGIIGVNVNNFAFNDGAITGAGNAAEEGAIKMRELTGIATMNNDDFSFSAAQTVEIKNTAGDLVLNIDNTTMRDTQSSATGEGGLQVVTTGTTSVHPTRDGERDEQQLPAARHRGRQRAGVRRHGQRRRVQRRRHHRLDLRSRRRRDDRHRSRCRRRVEPGLQHHGQREDLQPKGAGGEHLRQRLGKHRGTHQRQSRHQGAFRQSVPAFASISTRTAPAPSQIDNNVVDIAGFDAGIEVSSLGKTTGAGGTLDVSITNNDITLGPDSTNGIFLLVASDAGDTNTLTANVANNAVTLYPASSFTAFRARAPEAGGTLLSAGFHRRPHGDLERQRKHAGGQRRASAAAGLSAPARPPCPTTSFPMRTRDASMDYLFGLYYL